MRNWKDICPCWTICEQALTRTDSFRKFKICDLVIADTKYGPTTTVAAGPDKMLALILRGPQKDQATLTMSTVVQECSLLVSLLDSVVLMSWINYCTLTQAPPRLTSTYPSGKANGSLAAFERSKRPTTPTPNSLKCAVTARPGLRTCAAQLAAIVPISKIVALTT